MSTIPHTSAAFSATLRVHLDNRPGAFARMAAAIGEAGGLLDAIDLVRLEHGKKVRDVTILAVDEEHIARITEAVSAQDGIEVEQVADRTLLLHRGGKLEIASKVPLKTPDDLSMAYTPGVARACRAIADEPDKVWNLTSKSNTVAIVTDGTAVLGLGDIGPEAALPVMEGKAILFKEFAGVDAWPICLATTDPDEIVRTVVAIAPGFGGINLEDISAPRCFEIEARLASCSTSRSSTTTSTARRSSSSLRSRTHCASSASELEDVRVVVTGAGAAGSATARMLPPRAPARSSAATGRARSTPAARSRPVQRRAGRRHEPARFRGSADEALAGADVYIGLSGPGAVSVDGIRSMADGRDRLRDGQPDARDHAGGDRGPRRRRRHRPLATTRTRSTTCSPSPGIFRGALDVRATAINEDMKLAAARALAAVVPPDHLAADYVLPSVLDRSVAPAIADAVARAAIDEGVTNS